VRNPKFKFRQSAGSPPAVHWKFTGPFYFFSLKIIDEKYHAWRQVLVLTTGNFIPTNDYFDLGDMHGIHTVAVHRGPTHKF
jgi:hypothetical protein